MPPAPTLTQRSHWVVDVLFLLADAVLLVAAPAQAQAQTTDVLQVIRDVRTGGRSWNRLEFALDRAVPSAIRTNGTLTIGTTEFSLSSASFSNSNQTVTWINPGFNWTDNQQVAVSLTLPPTVTLSAPRVEPTWA